MSAAAVLAAAHAAGVKVWAEAGDLALAADTAPPADVLEGLRAHKAEVLALLREGKVAAWLNVHPQPSPAGRCAWCGGEAGVLLPHLASQDGTAHTWLHETCWPDWYAKRWAEAGVKAFVSP